MSRLNKTLIVITSLFVFLLLPSSSSAIYIPYIPPVERFEALPGNKCIGSINDYRITNDCTGYDIAKVWYRTKTRLCYLTDPAKDSLPFSFKNGLAYDKSGKKVYEITWIDAWGETSKKTYQKVTTKGVLCKAARQEQALAATADKASKPDEASGLSLFVGLLVFFFLLAASVVLVVAMLFNATK